MKTSKPPKKQYQHKAACFKQLYPNLVGVVQYSKINKNQTLQRQYKAEYAHCNAVYDESIAKHEAEMLEWNATPKTEATGAFEEMLTLEDGDDVSDLREAFDCTKAIHEKLESRLLELADKVATLNDEMEGLKKRLINSKKAMKFVSQGVDDIASRMLKNAKARRD